MAWLLPPGRPRGRSPHRKAANGNLWVTASLAGALRKTLTGRLWTYVREQEIKPVEAAITAAARKLLSVVSAILATGVDYRAAPQI